MSEAPAPVLRPPDDEPGRFAWLRLARSRRVGPRTFLRLLMRHRTAEEALDALPALAAGAGERDWRPVAKSETEAELAAAARVGARMLCLGAADYPALLATLPDPPPLLWALGEPEIAARDAVAVVGARNASASGRRFAEALARDLGKARRVVVSGLARGIDAAAHEGALETGTIAVVAGGVDVVYPPQNARLAEAIAERGLILSEAPIGEQPTARSFPKRNRIVAGLSAGVVLVEAAERSGSLITARLALEQGREAMAVPGSPLDPRSAGCNALIREGAALIRSCEDVLEALGEPRAARLRDSLAGWRPQPPTIREGPPRPDDAQEPGEALDRVLGLLGPTAVPFDALCRLADLSPARLSEILLELELEGRVERRAGDLVAAVAGAG